MNAKKVNLTDWTELIEIRKGFVIQVFTLFFIIGLTMGIFIAGILIASGHLKLILAVETNFERPSMTQISANSFMRMENSYPDQGNEMRNIMSNFRNSGDDAVLRQAITDSMDEMFDVVGDSSNVMVKVGDLYFNKGLMGDHDTGFGLVAYPEGQAEKIQVRVYK